MAIKISRPAPRSDWNKNDHEDHHVMFVHPESDMMDTTWGEKEIARCEYAGCLDCFEFTTKYVAFGTVLVPQLVGTDDPVKTGRLVQGEAKKGQSPPWLLEDPTEEDMAAAQAFIDQYGSQSRSGAISLDLKAIERDKPEQKSDDF